MWTKLNKKQNRPKNNYNKPKNIVPTTGLLTAKLIKK